MKKNIVLGLDPGSRKTGWGVVQEESGVLSLLGVGVINLNASWELGPRLGEIFLRTSEIVKQYEVMAAAVEEVFVAHSAASALKLGQARGAAIAALAALERPIFSYTPTSVKKAIVGVGRAEKSQVAYMIAQLLGLVNTESMRSLPADATDALAVAVCHLNQQRFLRLMKK